MPTSAKRARGLDAIVEDVLTKPFSLDDMRSAVSRALAAKRLRGSGGASRARLAQGSDAIPDTAITGSSGVQALLIIIGIIITMASLLGGFWAMGGHVPVIWATLGNSSLSAATAFGTYIVANSPRAPSGIPVAPASRRGSPGFPGNAITWMFSGLLYILMRDIRAKGRNEVEPHIDDPHNSENLSSAFRW